MRNMRTFSATWYLWCKLFNFPWIVSYRSLSGLVLPWSCFNLFDLSSLTNAMIVTISIAIVSACRTQSKAYFHRQWLIILPPLSDDSFPHGASLLYTRRQMAHDIRMRAHIQSSKLPWQSTETRKHWRSHCSKTLQNTKNHTFIIYRRKHSEILLKSNSREMQPICIRMPLMFVRTFQLVLMPVAAPLKWQASKLPMLNKFFLKFYAKKTGLKWRALAPQFCHESFFIWTGPENPFTMARKSRKPGEKKPENPFTYQTWLQH